ITNAMTLLRGTKREKSVQRSSERSLPATAQAQPDFYRADLGFSKNFFRGLTLIACVSVSSSALAQSVTPTPTPRPLGTFILQEANTDCPAGFTCNNFRVTNPDATLNERGVIAVQAPTGQIKGVVVFFSGTDGYNWWGNPARQPLIPSFFQSLLDAGLELVQVRHSWVVASTGVQSGYELLASRPATVIRWVYDNIYAPLGLSHGIGEC